MKQQKCWRLFSLNRSIKRLQIKMSKKMENQTPTTGYQANIEEMYYLVYCGVSSYFNLNPIEVVVLSLVCSFHRKGLYCYASKELMAKIARTSSVTVFKALKRLKRDELIVQSYRNGRVCLNLGPEAIDRWKYVDKIINTAKNEKKKPRSMPPNLW